MRCTSRLQAAISISNLLFGPRIQAARAGTFCKTARVVGSLAAWRNIASSFRTVDNPPPVPGVVPRPCNPGWDSRDNLVYRRRVRGFTLFFCLPALSVAVGVVTPHVLSRHLSCSTVWGRERCCHCISIGYGDATLGPVQGCVAPPCQL